MATPAANAVPLCVDLDGTLTRTDLLFEAFFVLFKQNPLSIFLCIAWALRGRAYLNITCPAKSFSLITCLTALPERLTARPCERMPLAM